MRFAYVRGSNRRVITIIGIILAVGSASSVGAAYAWDNCLIGAERSSSGGDLHLAKIGVLPNELDNE